MQTLEFPPVNSTLDFNTIFETFNILNLWRIKLTCKITLCENFSILVWFACSVLTVDLVYATPPLSPPRTTHSCSPYSWLTNRTTLYMMRFIFIKSASDNNEWLEGKFRPFEIKIFVVGFSGRGRRETSEQATRPNHRKTDEVFVLQSFWSTYALQICDPHMYVYICCDKVKHIPNWIEFRPTTMNIKMWHRQDLYLEVRCETPASNRTGTELNLNGN